MPRIVACCLIIGLGLIVPGASALADKEITIGYQPIYNPWKLVIAGGELGSATGYKITWRKFDSGAKVINAMARGEVQIAMAGSSPIAAGVSRGLSVELIWIAEDIASAEALVVRDGSGIEAPRDLRGKTIGVPFASTTHFHLLFVLEQFGIGPKELTVRNMQPPDIVQGVARWRHRRGLRLGPGAGRDQAHRQGTDHLGPVVELGQGDLRRHHRRPHVRRRKPGVHVQLHQDDHRRRRGLPRRPRDLDRRFARSPGDRRA